MQSFPLGFNNYNLTNWDPEDRKFQGIRETDHWRGYYGNFASAVPVNAGTKNWCLTSTKVKTLSKNHKPPKRQQLEIKSTTHVH